MNFLSGYFDNLWLRLVRHNATTGGWFVNGTEIPATLPYLWADFIALTWTTLDGRFFRVTDVHAAGSTGGSIWQADAVGNRPVLISNQIQVASLALAYSTYPPATYPGLRVLPADVGSVMVAVGSDYLLATGECVLSRDAVITRVVSPAATFTAVTPTSAASGDDTLLTSAGVHGLTTAICVTAGVTYIYISGGTNWVAGLHKINAIAVDTTGVTIQIDTRWDPGFGAPTIALAGTEFIIKKITVPRMTSNGYLNIDATWGSTSGVGTKAVGIRLGDAGAGLSGTAHYTPTAIPSTHLVIHPIPVVIQNRGVTNVQVNQYAASNIGGGANSTTVGALTGGIQTNVPTDLVLTGKMTSANDPIWVDRAVVKYGT